MKIFDADGKELGPGEIGEVYIRIGGFPDFTYNGMDDKRREVERDGPDHAAATSATSMRTATCSSAIACATW